MNKKKWFWIGGIALFVGIAGILTYRYLANSKSYPLWKFMPPDAVFVIETDHVLKTWDNLHNNKIWNSLLQDPLMKDIQEQARELDSMLQEYPKLYSMLKNRPMLISCHLISPNSYDFLFIIDLKKAQWVSVAKEFIFSVASTMGYSVDKENFEGEKIYTIQNAGPLYISMVGNIILVSYTKSIVQHAIKTSQQNNPWENNLHFKQNMSYLENTSMKFYFFQPYFSRYLAYFIDNQDLLKMFSSTFSIGTYNVNIDDNTIRLKGALHLSDSSFSLLHALNKVEKGNIYSMSIVPDNAALYVSLSFDDFHNLLTQLKSYSSSDTNLQAFEPYQKRIQKALKLFGIDVEKLFFSWIGKEIAIVKLPPSPNIPENDLLFMIHANDIEKAYEGIETITEKISRWLPIKDKEKEYNHYTIHYFGLKGFFKLFFGKLFNSLEKPYYIFLEDFVVFSNSPTLLMKLIDAYSNNHTFEHNESFKDFLSNMSDETNVRIILQGPRAFQHLYYYASAGRKKDVMSNQLIFTSFKYLGIELYRAEDNIYKSNILAYYDEDVSFETSLLDMERDAENLYKDDLDSLLAIKFPENEEESTPLKIYYNDDLDKLLAQGKMEDGQPTGLWKFYYRSGNLWATIPFSEGKPDGTVIVYFDESEPITKISCTFSEGKLDGTYIEYYKNGEIKAKLEYKEGLLDGQALFFYESGTLKIEGEYANGEKTGKWKHYTETGDLITKEKWKRGRKK